jgi:rhodanese-related sulfurtransferase
MNTPWGENVDGDTTYNSGEIARITCFLSSGGLRGGAARATSKAAAKQQRSAIMAKHSPRFLQLVNDSKKRVRETTVDEVKKRLDRGDKFALIDVREESEFARGRLPGAIHLGKGIIERDVETKFPDTATELVLYCGGGYRSALAADNLQKMGYTNVISMDGGFREWKEKGHLSET